MGEVCLKLKSKLNVNQILNLSMHNFEIKKELSLISGMNPGLHGLNRSISGKSLEINNISNFASCLSSLFFASLLFTFLFSGFISLAFAGQTEFDKEIEISDLSEGELRLNEFKISESTHLRITGRAFGNARSRHMLAYAWILDADSREIVWKMDIDNALTLRRSRRGGRDADLLRYDESLGIDEGNYELYYAIEDPAMVSPIILRFQGRGRGGILENLMGRNRARIPVSSMGITISGNSGSFNENIGYLESLKENSVVDSTPASDNKYFRQGFNVAEDINVRIYAMGEFATYDETGNDFGWIANAITKEKIWEMRRSFTEHAGGGEKNRKIDEIIKIPQGEYVAYYVSDGSHSFSGWNVPSPFDPYFWGLSILPSSSDFNASSARSRTTIPLFS